MTSLCLCARVYASRGVVDGFGLLHELLADVMEDLVDAIAKHNQQNGGGSQAKGGPADAVGSPVKGAAADSWTIVSSAAAETCRENSKGTSLHAA